MAISNPYRVYTVAIAAGAEETIAAAGQYVAPITSNLDEFALGIDGGPRQFLQVGLQIRLPEGQKFTSITVLNPNASTLILKIAIGFGSIVDARLAVTNTSLTVASRALGAGFTNRTVITNTPLALVAPAVNVAGLLVTTGAVRVDTGANAALLGLDGTEFSPSISAGPIILMADASTIANLPSPILLPPGIGLFAAPASLGSCQAWASWTVL